ncbi:hypothetical protein [Parabacteroides massiliensis]|uniref:hypothetical protein n=1 Tax=Parabacteroides massiliensis TaxID=1750560 RepID=UPI001FC906A0|nr:hypothetical protein [Parabacteroides massiliensis]
MQLSLLITNVYSRGAGQDSPRREKSAVTTTAPLSGCGVLKSLSFTQEVSERANTATTITTL